MRVILRENIENLGKKGDIVDVASGFGRNYLIPKKIAIEVTPRNLKMIEIEQKALQKGFEKEKASYQELIDQLNTVTLSFTRKTSEKDVVFGSVSSADIRDALALQDFDIEKKKILLEEPIKRLGNYTVPIKIFHEERAEVKLEVVKEGEQGVKEEAKLGRDLVEEGDGASETVEEKKELPDAEENPEPIVELEVTEAEKEATEKPSLEETKKIPLDMHEEPLDKKETEPGESPEESGVIPEDASAASSEPEGKTEEDESQEAKSKDNK